MDEVEMPEIAVRIAEARSAGDLKENAEYMRARNRKACRPRSMCCATSSAGPDRRCLDLAKDEVVFGSTVVVKDLDFGDEEVFKLVGQGRKTTTPARF